MSDKLVPTTKSFDCPKCGRITFRCIDKQVFASEIDEPIHTLTLEITSFGKCYVAANAAHPGRPVADEMAECPFSQSLR